MYLNGDQDLVEIRTLSMAEMGKKDSAQAVTLQGRNTDICTTPFRVCVSLRAVDVHLTSSLVLVLPAPSPMTGRDLR